MTQMDVYAQRRERVLEQLAPGGALLLCAAPELLIGRDSHLRYVVDAELFYLTGYTEPEAVLLLDPNGDAPFMMFVRARDAERELWQGRRGGVEAAREIFAADEAHPVAELPELLPRLLARTDTVYARPSGRPEIDGIVQQLFASGRAARARTGRGPHILREPGDILDEMRLVKDEHELPLIREAARITAESFLATLPQISAGLHESDVEALLEFGFRRRGASGPAFTTIAASGLNATILHYVDNTARLEAGELLLLDAGARYQMYCGDVSRTVPVSGRFSEEQRAWHDVVLAAHDAAIAAAQPGQPFDAVHHAAREVLVSALADEQLLTDAQREDENAIKQFYPHRTSHWLGLEVHDVGPYARADGPVLLQPGMVLTIEPGLYLPDRNLGVRIEDDVLITANGPEVLTGILPAAASDIEALLQ